MLTLIALILVCICLILLGAERGKPTGWVIVVLAVLALLMTLGGLHKLL